MILLIDNYDSFSYNLFQLLGSRNPDIKVIRNDALPIAQIESLHPQAILLSPGPGKPQEAGICMDVVSAFYHKIPILGICLGHQAIYSAFGGQVSYAKQLLHGKQTPILLDTSCPIFAGMPQEIPAARYHSLAAQENTLPEELKIISKSQDGEIMAVAHKRYPVYGLQFHPESILTPCGGQIIDNFLKEIWGNKND